MKHPLIEFFHLSNLLQMLNNHRMVDVEFLGNFSCSCKRISFYDPSVSHCQLLLFIYLLYFFKFYFIFKLYITVLVLPNIKTNPPQVYTCSPSRTPLPPRTIPLGHPSAPAQSILYHALNLDWQFISHMIIYRFQCHSPKSSHPHLLPQSPKVCSLHLGLFCCLPYRVIINIFLNSIYMRCCCYCC